MSLLEKIKTALIICVKIEKECLRRGLSEDVALETANDQFRDDIEEIFKEEMLKP